jgi:hypothetical protein
MLGPGADVADEGDSAVAGVYPHVGVDCHQPVPVEGVLHQVGHVSSVDVGEDLDVVGDATYAGQPGNDLLSGVPLEALPTIPLSQRSPSLALAWMLPGTVTVIASALLAAVVSIRSSRSQPPEPRRRPLPPWRRIADLPTGNALDEAVPGVHAVAVTIAYLAVAVGR